MLAADERRGLERKIVGARRQGPQRRMVVRHVRAAELKDALRASQVAQAMLPEVSERGAIGQPFPSQPGGHGREDGLTAVGAVHQPGSAVECRAKVLLAL